MRKQNRVFLNSGMRRYKFFFDRLKKTTDDYLFFCDIDDRVSIISPQFLQDFDFPGEIVQRFSDYWLPLICEEDLPLLQRSMEQALSFQDGTSVGHDLRYRIRMRNGEYVWVHERGQMWLDRDTHHRMMTGMIYRMAERNEADEITGLLNYYQFGYAMNRELERFRATQVGGAIMIFGVDNFKIINEAHNRAVGNRALKEIAHLLLGILPPEVSLYKLDGDEFAVLYPKASQREIEDLFYSAQRTLASPQTIDGYAYTYTASCGAVFYPMGGRDMLVLYKHAEAALERAKREGKNRLVFFNKEEYNRWLRSLSIKNNIRGCVENDCEGFSLCYQPQVEAKTRRIFGAEALLRWKNPKGRMVAPREFIPLLEETKLIIPVGKWVIAQALAVCRKWRLYIPDFSISVNLSYEQLRDASLLEYIMQQLQMLQLPPQCLTLELTESEIVADWGFVNREFDRFRAQGITIAMDDFGTGYSSLASLKNLSCDVVKIDREFVKHIMDNEFDRKLVDAVVLLCHSIGIHCCIEGVEGEPEYELLANRCGVDFIQGYLFGRPEKPEDFEAKFLLSNDKNREEETKHEDCVEEEEA